MAYTTLVAPQLTEGLIDAGERLVRRLDAAKIPITAAFWLLADADAGWRLVLASADVSRVGIKHFYSKLNDHLRSLGDSELTISHVTAVRPDDPTAVLLRSAVKTGQDLSRIRFTGNVINGKLIPDALIYRLQ